MEAVPRLLNGLLMLALPLALAAFLARRLRAPWGLFATGAAGFLLSQILHIPFNLAVLNSAIQRAGFTPEAGFPGSVLGPLLLGLSAGAFEEPARYLMFRLAGREGRSWSGGLMLGAGHGGLESITLGVLVLYGFFQAAAYRGTELSALLPPGQLAAAEANLTAYWSAPAHTALLGALERVLAICMHLGLSILVLQSVRRRNILWLALAVVWHMLVDAAALVVVAAWGVWAAEGALAVLALVSLGAVFGLRGRSGELPEPPVAPGFAPARQPAAGPHRREPPVNPKRLDDSRYSED
jgi:uncharacterized membrane protein YhfC